MAVLKGGLAESLCLIHLPTAFIFPVGTKNQGCQMVYVFKPKIPILANFGGLAMENLGIFYDHLVCFTAI
jgi:hypothetical protein